MKDVLLVNDNEQIMRQTAARLEAMGWDVYLAGSEKEVFESCVASKPSMVIVDVEMGGAAAFDCIGTARVLYPDLFIVAITRSRTDKLWPGAVAVCGANRFVDGPITSSVLSRVIESGHSQGLINPVAPSDVEQRGWANSGT